MHIHLVKAMEKRRMLVPEGEDEKRGILFGETVVDMNKNGLLEIAPNFRLELHVGF